MNVRPAAVAGLFYPGDAKALRATVESLLAEAAAEMAPNATAPKGLIVPHAGYQYSGPVAAKAYAQLSSARRAIRRVVLIGPSHRVAFDGLAVSSAEAWETPLGRVPVDREGVEIALALPHVETLDAAHAREHSLEVQLPFLQVALEEFSIVPVVAGTVTPEQVGLVLDSLWNGPETLIVVSSDLSHFHDAATASKLDAETARFIEAGAIESLNGRRACGYSGIGGLLSLSPSRRLQIERLDLRNSGDISGDRDRVVGYGAWLVS